MFRRIRDGIGRVAGRVANFVRGRRSTRTTGQLALPPGSRGRARTSGS